MMYVVVAVLALVMEAPAVLQTCPEFCKSITSSIADVTLQRECNCFSGEQLTVWPKRGHYLEIDNSGIYYEPADIYPAQHISFVENPFYILFKLDTETPETLKSNKITAKRTSDNNDYEVKTESKENLRDNKIDRNTDTKTKGFPLYLDLDIADSITIERTPTKEDSKIKDFDLTEQDLVECIDLHILINARQSDNTNELKVVWGAEKFDKYENFTDSDIKIEIESKCSLTANVIEQSLKEIRETLPSKNNQSSRSSSNSEEEFKNISRIFISNDQVNDNNSTEFQNQNEGASTSKVKFTISYDYTKSNLTNTTTGHYDVDNKVIQNGMVTPDQSTEQSTSNIDDISTENSTNKKLSTRSTSTETSNTNNEYTVTINEQLNDQLSTDSLTSNFVVDETTKASNIIEDNENYTTQVAYQLDSDILNFSSKVETITTDGYREATTISNTEIPLYITRIRENIKEKEHNFTHYNPKIKSTKSGAEEHFTDILPMTQFVTLNELNKQNNYNNNKKDFLETVNNQTLNNDANIINDSIEHESDHRISESILHSDHHLPLDKNMNTTEIKKENRNENKVTEMKISQIETIEFENGTAVSSVNDSDQRSSELDTIAEETKYVNNYTDVKLDNSTIYNSNSSEISGSLYFIFDKENIPARFVQKSDGKIHIGIDGNSLCNKLNFSETNSVLLSVICNNVRYNNTLSNLI